MRMSFRNWLKIQSWTATILGAIQSCLYLLGGVLVFWLCFKLGSSLGSGVWPPIERVADWAQVVIAYAALFAIGQYAVAYSDIADRKTKVVLDFVKFFRETVLQKGSEINIYIRKNKIDFPKVLVRKNTPPFKFTAEEFFKKIVPNQIGLVQAYSKILADDPVFESMIVACLNSAEEFAIGILNSKSEDHEAVSSIKKPFLELVENLAVPLYYQIGMMDDQFAYLSRLYRHWKSEVGFLPLHEDDRVERYRERQAKYTT